MHIDPIVAAADGGTGDLVVGLLIGLVVGVFAGPALRSWLTLREWAAASRQAQLSDRLLNRLRLDARESLDPADGDGRPAPTRTEEGRRTSAWRTSP
jgi:hypothetical protein